MYLNGTFAKPSGFWPGRATHWTRFSYVQLRKRICRDFHIHFTCTPNIHGRWNDYRRTGAYLTEKNVSYTRNKYLYFNTTTKIYVYIYTQYSYYTKIYSGIFRYTVWPGVFEMDVPGANWRKRADVSRRPRSGKQSPAERRSIETDCRVDNTDNLGAYSSLPARTPDAGKLNDSAGRDGKQ